MEEIEYPEDYYPTEEWPDHCTDECDDCPYNDNEYYPSED